ncbi:hypothetical protein [Solidesulfovibrio sp.]
MAIDNNKSAAPAHSSAAMHGAGVADTLQLCILGDNLLTTCLQQAFVLRKSSHDNGRRDLQRRQDCETKNNQVDRPALWARARIRLAPTGADMAYLLQNINSKSSKSRESFVPHPTPDPAGPAIAIAFAGLQPTIQGRGWSACLTHEKMLFGPAGKR